MSEVVTPVAPPQRGRKKKRSRLQKAVSRHVGYVLLRAIHAVACRLPLPVGRAVASCAGTMVYYLASRQRALALQNLTRAFGTEKTEAEIRSLARGVFRNMALTVAEWVILRRWPAEKLWRTFPEVLPVLDQLQADVRATGTGGVGVTGHYGNWEVLSLFFGRHVPGFLVPVANRVYFPKYQDFVHRLRTGCGVKVIYSDESPRRVIREIKDENLPSFLPDVDLRTNSGVFVEFFGQPTYTVTFPVDLARKYGAIITLALLQRDGRKFRLHYRPIRVPRTEDEQADVLAGTQEWTRGLEEQIRKTPDQWAWVQPRWRTTPDRPRKKTDRVPRRR